MEKGKSLITLPITLDCKVVSEVGQTVSEFHLPSGTAVGASGVAEATRRAALAIERPSFTSKLAIARSTCAVEGGYISS